MQRPRSSSPDKRVERSRSKVLAETYQQLSRSGIAGVSIDEISRQSGVSKTTIYRHWPSRSALLLDACAQFGRPAPVPDSGSLRRDLLTLLKGLAEQLAAEMWSRVYPSILDAAEREPDIAALQNQMHRSFMAPFEQVIARGRESGDASVLDRNTSIVVAELIGPLFFRRWFSREKIDAAFLTEVLDRALGKPPNAQGALATEKRTRGRDVEQLRLQRPGASPGKRMGRKKL